MNDRAPHAARPQAAPALRRALLGWYDAHRRELPWRADPPDPYHVLVSEAMLQQTQVATVIDYFHRFIERFPTLEALAAADEQAVLHAWQGLGYYRRARHLHAAARMILSEHDGKIPSDESALRALPGVGRYTAGAIASIAFGRRAALVDGNVARVLARWFVIECPISDPATQRKLWALAEKLVPVNRPGDFNQALMELGATVCTPTSPSCPTCPAAGHCMANRQGRAHELPRASPRRAPRAVEHHILAVHRGAKYLLEQRQASGLWSNMWQFPTVETLEGVSEAALIDWVRERFGLHVDTPRRVETFTHQTTHRRITFTVHRAAVTAGRLRTGAGLWRALGNTRDLPLANPQQRTIEMLSDSRVSV